MMKNSYYKQNGIILPVVLIFFSVLMLLGVTFLSVSGFQITQSTSQVRRSEAYYLAKSGAEVMADHIHRNAEEIVEIDEFMSEIETDGFISVGFGEMDPKFLKKNPELVVNTEIVEKNEKTYIEITSRAEVLDGSSEVKMMMELVTVHSGAIGEGVAVILVGNKLDNQNFTILNDYLDEQSINDYPSPSFPVNHSIDMIDLSDREFVVGGNQVKEINRNIYYEKISVLSQNDNNKRAVLNIDADINTYKDTRIIRVKELIIDGVININSSSGNKVIIFVEETLSFGRNKNVSVNVDGDPNNLMILYSGNDEISTKNKVDFNGLLYAPGAQINLGNQADFKGSVVVNDLTANGNKAVIDGRNVYYDIFQEFTEGQSVGSADLFHILQTDAPWLSGDDYD